jgi:predicted phage terminase large subunit-like protein
MISAETVHGFVESVLSKGFDDSSQTPQFHLELWEEACSEHQFIAIAAPRGHAKTTAGTISYGLCELLFRERRYCVIVSDTEAQSAMFVQQMAQELQTNQELIELFGLKKDEKGVVRFLRDSQTDIIVEMSDGHTFRVVAKGAEQKLRGMLWNNRRPDLVIVDDLENDELVMNVDRRTKLKRWFRGALIPMMSRTGKLRMWGTVLHEDSVLNNLMPKQQDKYYRESELKQWTDHKRRSMWRTIKYKAHNPDYSEILWPERYDKGFFIMRKKEYTEQGMSDIYSQEFLNEPIDESVALVKKGDLLPITDEDKKLADEGHKHFRYYITADLAVSEKEKADYTVFVVAGVDDNRIIYIKDIIRARMDAMEIIETMFVLHSVYDPEAIGMEKMLVSQTLGPLLKEEMRRRDQYPNFVQLTHGGKDKVQRFRNMQGRLRAKTVKFDKTGDWYPVFEDEILKFPRGTKDDQVDALAYLGMLLDKMINAPTEEEIEDEEYALEYANARSAYDGRSSWTGY